MAASACTVIAVSDPSWLAMSEKIEENYHDMPNSSPLCKANNHNR